MICRSYHGMLEEKKKNNRFLRTLNEEPLPASRFLEETGHDTVLARPWARNEKKCPKALWYLDHYTLLIPFVPSLLSVDMVGAM